MKRHAYYFTALCAIVTCALVFYCCDSPDFREVVASGTDNQVTIRTDCEDCDPDCCCAIELDDDTAATIHLCGTTDGAGACSESSSCGTGNPSGGGQFVSLTSALNQRHVFCMEMEMPLRIWNTSSTDDADLTLTCQYSSGLPQVVQIHLEPNGTTGEDRVFYETNESCELSLCD